MYRLELDGKGPEELPQRFHKMILAEKLFDDQIRRDRLVHGQH